MKCTIFYDILKAVQKSKQRMESVLVSKAWIYMLFLLMLTGTLGACGKKSGPVKAVTDEVEYAEQSEEMKAEGIIWPDVVPYMTTLPTSAESAAIFVEPIEGLSKDFVKGIDASGILALEENGVTFYNKEGNPQDFFQILADSGINYIRVCVWNSSEDDKGVSRGNGYDAVTAAVIGRRAAACDIKLLVDFRYADFGENASKQAAPKDWQNITYWEKIDAIYTYTRESLELILAAGADVGMVQIGNEIDDGVAGETDWEHMLPLLKAASLAVRDVEKSRSRKLQIAVHPADVSDRDRILQNAEILENAELDYDVLGVSYRPYEHGSLENLTATLAQIHEKYGKKTAVLETAYTYSAEKYDTVHNLLPIGNLLPKYGGTVQSQASCIRDVMAATAAAGEAALGIFYWEEHGYGSGDTAPAGMDALHTEGYLGQGIRRMQEMFDITGHPFASLDVFKYVNYGTICDAAVDFVETALVYMKAGEALELPGEVSVIYIDRSLSKAEPVAWNEADYQDIRTDRAGEYMITGVLEDGTKAACRVVIEE